MNNRTLDFITRILKDTMKLDVHYILEPYNNLSVFDRFFRESMENSDLLYKEILDFIYQIEHSMFHIITDSFGMNFIFFYPYDTQNDLITIGPYFTQEIENEYWHTMTEKHKLNISNVAHLKGFLYSLPVINNNLSIISTANDIINFINPDTSPYSVTYHDFTEPEKGNSSFLPKSDFYAYVKLIENRYNTEKELLRHIANGDSIKALEYAKKFVSSPFEPRLKNSFRERKSLLITANTAYRKAIEPNEIHPVYLHEITSKYVNLIENATNETALDRLFEKMIRDYCLLVKNKSSKQYSPVIRKTLHFIEFNLDSKLSLIELADQNGVSVPYLSTLFKKEVGTTIIKYANQLRIHQALQLLNSSSLSIQDIASYVGIYDYNYFTKVFKKEVGVAPTEYRKHLTDTVDA